MPCDVQKDDDIARVFEEVRDIYGRLDFLVHSIAFAPPQELRKPYVEMSREGWHLAMDISVYSLVAACRAAAPLMTDGGAIVTISYYGGEKVVPGYNVMGVCKAALEHSVRYLAWDLGRQRFASTASVPGRCARSSAAGISGFDDCASTPPRNRRWAQHGHPKTSATPALFAERSVGRRNRRDDHVDCGYSIVGL